MSWARIDDKYFGNPKIIAAGAQGGTSLKLLHIASISYINAFPKTLGIITPAQLPSLALNAEVRGRPRAINGMVEQLVTIGLWDVVEGGWEVHGWREFAAPPPGTSAAERGRMGGEATQRKNRQANQAEGV